MNTLFKKFGWGHAGLALMGLTILACGGGSGGTDRTLDRNFYAINAGYSGNAQKFNVGLQNIPTTGPSVFALEHGKISEGHITFTNKQLDPIPFVIKNASTDATLATGSQQTTSSDRHFVVSYGPDSALKAAIVPLEPISGLTAIFDVAMLDSSETHTLDLYLLPPGATLAASTPIFTGLKYSPLSPTSMVQQKIMAMGGSYTLNMTISGTKTAIPSYTQSVTLTDKFFHLLIFTKDAAGSDSFMIEQKRAPG